MADEAAQAHGKLSWRFPATFWFANAAELCERAAYYGMFITLYRYLNTDIGFTDPQTGIVTALFAGGIYFLPTFMGIMADKIGFKQALLLAFTLLTGGYALLGAFQLKLTAVVALSLIMCGGAIIKPVISGTVAKCSDDAHRVRAMSIFYMVVNIGSFSGKGLAGYLNEALGLQFINFYAAGMSFAALLLVAFRYRNPDTEGVGKTVGEALAGLWKVLQNFRFLSLIVIIAGFWLIQGQLYGAMPTFIERVLGKGYKPEWLANINPLTVVILVVPITHVVRRFRPESAIGIGLFIIPFTALLIALGGMWARVTGKALDLGFFHVHPLVLAIIVGIALQGLAECFLSPKFLEYASKQAPKGEVGLYLGYQHLTTFIAWFAGFIAAGFLLDAYCPDPRKFDPPTRHQWRLATDPQYRFTLDAALRPALGNDIAVPEPLRQALEHNDLEIPRAARLIEEPPRDAWRRDPERTWLIEEPLVTIRETPAKEGEQRLLRVESSPPPSAVAGEEAAPAFNLPVELATCLDEETVRPQLAEALGKHGVVVPPEAVIRKQGLGDSEGGGPAWEVAGVCATIEEAKLESDADAASAGRERALRDVLVLSDRPRPAAQAAALPAAYAKSHYIWYAFAAVGFAAFGALLVFRWITGVGDRRRGVTAERPRG